MATVPRETLPPGAVIPCDVSGPLGGRIESLVRVSYVVGGGTVIDPVRVVDQFFGGDGAQLSAVVDGHWERSIAALIELGRRDTLSGRDFRLHVVALAIARQRVLTGAPGLHGDVENELGLRMRLSTGAAGPAPHSRQGEN